VPRFPLIPSPAQLSLVRRRVCASLLAGVAWPLLSACDRLGGGEGFRGIDLTGAAYAQDFSLTDFHGRSRTLADYRGQVVMLYFGFVQCPDVCPTALARASAVMQQLGTDAGRVRLLFVTVDPERDTPELLRAYLAAFDPRFVALTGNLAQIQATADAFRAVFKKVPTGSSYTMDHTALTYLFDPAGRIRVALRHEQTVDDYTADVRRLLAEPAL
jgi:protein SCO1/2